MPNCIGCTKEAGDAPVHIISSGVDADEVRIWWHHDCHVIVTGCELCHSVVDAYPEQKDAALGAAIMAAPHPFAAALAATNPTPEA